MPEVGTYLLPHLTEKKPWSKPRGTGYEYAWIHGYTGGIFKNYFQKYFGKNTHKQTKITLSNYPTQVWNSCSAVDPKVAEDGRRYVWGGAQPPRGTGSTSPTGTGPPTRAQRPWGPGCWRSLPGLPAQSWNADSPLIANGHHSNFPKPPTAGVGEGKPKIPNII